MRRRLSMAVARDCRDELPTTDCSRPSALGADQGGEDAVLVVSAKAIAGRDIQLPSLRRQPAAAGDVDQDVRAVVAAADLRGHTQYAFDDAIAHLRTFDHFAKHAR